MRIIEKFTAAKGGTEDKNEDIIVITPDFIGVFDGSSLAAGETIGGMNGGRFAATTLAGAVAKLPANINAQDAVQSLTASFNAAARKAAKTEGKDTAKSLAAAGMTLYSRQRQEIWSVADCPFVIDGDAYSTALPPAALRSQIRQYLIHAELQKGITEEELLTNDPTPALIAKGVMAESKIFANNPDPVFGYGVLNGNPVPNIHIKVVSTQGAKEIVIASDGYPRIFMSLQETEEYLARAIAEDPLCYKTNPQPKAVLKGQKRYDDVSYVRFQP